jgi:predicted amino acid dehydrogenase
MTKEIVSVSLGLSDADYEFATRAFGAEFHIQRIGTDGDIERARTLVADFDGKADAIGLGEMNLRFSVGQHTCTQRQIKGLAGGAKVTPVVDGSHLRRTLDRWLISQAARQHEDLFRYRRIFFLSGVDQFASAQVLNRYTDRFFFGDPIFHLNLPFALRSFGQLELYARWVLPRLCNAAYAGHFPTGKRADLSSNRGERYFKSADVIVGSPAYLRLYAPNDLRRKVIVTSALSDGQMAKLRDRGADSVVAFSPLPRSEHPAVDTDVVEAMLATLLGPPIAEHSDDDYLQLISQWELEPQVTVLNPPPAVNRFAFVIHPLTVDHIFSHPLLRFLRFVPRSLVERSVANMRPTYLSRIKGIRSAATGQEVEGFLITLGATPREFLRRKPGFTYRRLIVASRMAQRMGAKIMGLGAFTKVVGDAGITVAQKADIAITSGNSLTVVATLEAAKQAVVKMGAQDLTKGRAMVIGATGSIGSVCSRLLAQAIHDVVLIAPRPEGLLALKSTIEAETPGARVVVATDPGPHLAEADLVVTTTTAIGEKVIDVLKLRPGCVVCDVARPPDVKEEDALLRPDVLVIESGEVLLPGKPDFGFDIGLPPGVAYACLAETAVLAMEGRYENFTLGRNIEMEPVKEMYRLFKKHGLELEGLRSFGRYVTDEDVSHKRALADELRQHPEKLELLSARLETPENGRTLKPRRATSDPRLAQAAWALLASLSVAATAILWRRRRGE